MPAVRSRSAATTCSVPMSTSPTAIIGSAAASRRVRGRWIEVAFKSAMAAGSVPKRSFSRASASATVASWPPARSSPARSRPGRWWPACRPARSAAPGRDADRMLAILTTHPIQYQVPVWQALAQEGRLPFEVWYLTDHGSRPSLDRGFGKTFRWDIETLAGYPHRIIDVAQGALPDAFWKCRLRERLRHRLRVSAATALWVQGWQVAAYWQAVREARAAGAEVWLRGESNDLSRAAWWKRPLKQLALGRLF